MKEVITAYVGLDIHKDTVAVAVADEGRATPRFIGTIHPSPAELCKTLRRNRCTPHRSLLIYEAGPCGYGWARYLRKQGWRCEVIAPSRITRQAAEKRLKTDRRDAMLLARESRAGNLTPIVVPEERDEAIRDLCRTREDAMAARLKARQQLKAMLLRLGRVYHGKSSWTQAHERHLSTIHFEHAAQQIAFEEYRQSIKEAHERVERLAQALREQCEGWRMKPVVKALMCLRGVDFLAAVTLIAELGDLTRFAHPCSLMAYLGLVSSEFSSGNSRRQGSITRAGNKQARRILVESAWTYRFNPRVSRPLEVRQCGQPKVIRDIAWKAQLRLTYRFKKLNAGRKMTQNKCCVAVARELAGFIWDIARHVKITTA
jgi:transposase